MKNPYPEKKVYCELCNGEDKASICKWCYQDIKDKAVPTPSAKFWREESIRLNKELQKQRQEILDILERHVQNHMNESYNYHIFDDLKQQLNQPKTEQ